MKISASRSCAALLASFLALGAGGAAAAGEREAPAAPNPEALRKEIEALRVADVAWRGIPWKSCLLEGLIEAQRSRKPLMLWVFIDRPIDDQRC